MKLSKRKTSQNPDLARRKPVNFSIQSTCRLIVTFAFMGFKLRNEGSYLGLFWYLLNPIFTFLLLLVIFKDRLGSTIPEYPLYLLMGVIMFNFFQLVTTESTKVIQNFRGVIRSIYFPREVLVIQILLKAIFSHIFEICVFLLFMMYFQIPLGGILYYPFILFFLCLFTLGVSFMFCALTVYIADLENVWSFASKLLWLATPIFYTAQGVPGISVINMCNPLYYFLEVGRETVLYQHIPELYVVLGMIGYSFISFIFGLWIFVRLKSRFAELI